MYNNIEGCWVVAARSLRTALPSKAHARPDWARAGGLGKGRLVGVSGVMLPFPTALNCPRRVTCRAIDPLGRSPVLKENNTRSRFLQRLTRK
jgi:hypothetical protein